MDTSTVAAGRVAAVSTLARIQEAPTLSRSVTPVVAWAGLVFLIFYVFDGASRGD